MPDKKDKREKVTDPALLALLNGDDADVAVADKGKVTDPDLLAKLNGDDPLSKKKDSPALSEPPNTTASPLQGGPAAATTTTNFNPEPGIQPIQYTELANAPVQSAGDMKNTISPKYVPHSIQGTQQAVEHLAKDYISTHGADTPDKVNHINAITDPEGDPSILSNYIKDRFAQMNVQDPSHAQAHTIASDDLLNNAGYILKSQLAVQEYRTKKLTAPDAPKKIDDLDEQEKYELLHADPNQKGAIEAKYAELKKGVVQNENYDPIKLGMKLAIGLGDKNAERDYSKYLQGHKIDDQRKVAYEYGGYDVMQTGAKAAEARGEDEVSQDLSKHSDNAYERLEKNNPNYFKKIWGSQIGDYVYNNESNPLYGTIFTKPKLTKEEIQEYGKKAGLKQYQINQLTPDDVPTAASVYGQAAQSAYNTLLFKDENSVGGNIFTGSMPQAQKSGHDWKGALGEIAGGAGTVGAFMLQGGLTGTVLKGTGILGDAAVNASRYEKAANMIPIAAANYNDAYKKSEDIIGDAPEDAGKRAIYAIAVGTISTAIMGIEPATALGKQAIESTVSKDIANMLTKHSMEDISKEEVQSTIVKSLQKYSKIAGVTAEHMATQSFIMSSNKIAENVANMIFDPKHRHDAMDNVGETAISTSISMFLPSLMAGINTRRANTPLNKEIAFGIGSDPDKYTNQVAADLADNKITPEDATTAHDGILNMKAAVARTPTENVEKEPLTDEQRRDYAFNLFQQQQLQSKLDATKSETAIGDKQEDKSQTAPIDAKIKELVKANDEILANAGKEIPKPDAPQAKSNQTPADERSVATNPSSEDQTSATKEKNEEKTANTEKENIPLTPQEDNSTKTNENESNVRNKEGRQSSSNAEEIRPNAEEAANSERRHEPQETGELKNPPKGEQDQPDANRPVPTLQRQRRKFKPDIPVSDSPEAKPGEIPIVSNDQYQQWDQGKLEGKPEADHKKEIEQTPNDQKIGGGESFIEFKDRIQKAWHETKKSAKDQTAMIMHSSVMKMIEAGEKHGWDDIDKLREAYNKTEEPEIGKTTTYKTDNGEVHLTRHAESEDGKSGLLRTKDTPLTKEGEVQAKEDIAGSLKEEGIAPPEIHTDNQPRTEKTADIVAGELSKKKSSEATFKTSKGSEYILHDDGTTTRNKKARSDPGHEGQEGAQPRSEKTYFVTKEDADKLAIFQANGWKERGETPVIAEVGDKKLAVGIKGGKNDGTHVGGTKIDYKTQPEKGLLPVETFNNGELAHFGNEITEVNQGTEPSTERRNDASSEKKTSANKEKPQQNASTQSAKQSGQPEHARVEQAGSKEKAAQSTNSNSNQRGKKKEKVKSDQNRHQMDFATYNANKKLIETSGLEPRTLEEATLLHMAGGGKFIEGPEDGNSNPTGIAKHLSTRSGTEEYEAAREKWLAPHGSKSKVYDKKLKKNADAVNADKFGYNFNENGDQNEGEIGRILSEYPTQGRVYERLAEIVRERNKEDHPDDPTHDITIHDLQTGDKEVVSLNPNDPNYESQIASIMGIHPDDMPVSFTDENHPIFQEGLAQHEAIHDAQLTKEQVQTLYDLWDKHTGDDGKLNISTIVEDLAKEKEKFDKPTQDIIDKLGVFNSDEENEPYIQKLNQKIKEYEAANSKGADETTAEGAVGKVNADGSQPGGIEENGREEPRPTKPAGGAAGEKLNQAPADERSVATNPQPEPPAPAPKELTLVEKKTRALNKLKEEHNDLNFQKEELDTKLDHAYAKSKVDPTEVEDLEKQISDKRQEIAAKKKALDLKQRELEVQQAYSKDAEKGRKAVNKLVGDKKALASAIPFLNGETVRSVLIHALDLYEQFGNLHIAAIRAMEWAKEKFKGEEGINELTEDHIKDLVSPYANRKIEEPVIQDPDHLQTAKEILEDIQKGDITYEQARQEIMDDDSIYDKTRAKVLNYIDYRQQQAEIGIRNAITRLKREQFGLDQEIPSDKVTYDEIWQQAKNKIEENPDKAQQLVNKLEKHPRPVDALEDAILLHHNVALEKRNSDLNTKIIKASESGDRAAMVEYQLEKAAVADKMQQAYDVFKAVGTENARGLAFRRMMSDMKFTLVNMVSEKRAAANDGEALSKEQQAEIEKLHQKITDTQKELDDYKKQKEAQVEDQTSQIIELQQKALSGKIKNKTTAAAKLRNWANRISGVIKNAASSSPRLEIRKEVAASLHDIATGIEGGDELGGLVKKAVKKVKDANPDIDELHLEKEINRELIASGILEPSKEVRKAKNEVMSGFFKDGKLDQKLIDLNVAANRAKNQFDTDIKIDEQKKRTRWARAQDFFVKWQREFKLSNPLTLGKLTGAAAIRLATEAAEEGVGAGYTKLLPRLANGAIGEGNAAGFRVREYAKDMSRGLMLGMKDAAKILSAGSEGKSDLDVLFGKGGDLPPEAFTYMGELHSALKAPIKRAVFEKQLNKRLRNYAANGVDISDPMVQTQAMNDAYIDANRAIFMQDNKVSNWYQRQVKNFEKGTINKSTGKIETPDKWKSSALKYLVPFVKVPSNIVAETAKLAYGLPYGSFQAAHAYYTGEVDKLTSDQRDIVMRNLKKGTIGAAAMAIGLFASQNFGGFYQSAQDEKKKKRRGEPRAMGIDTPFGKLPQWAGEAPLFQAMQLGATTWRVWHERVEGEEKGLPSGVVASAMGLLDEQPLMAQALRVGNVIRERGSKRSLEEYFGELAKSTFVPAILDYVAKATDPADEGSIFHHAFDPENHRKPKTIIEHVESGVPGLREELPTK